MPIRAGSCLYIISYLYLQTNTKLNLMLHLRSRKNPEAYNIANKIKDFYTSCMYFLEFLYVLVSCVPF